MTDETIVRRNLHVRDNLRGQAHSITNAEKLAEYLRRNNTEPLSYEVEKIKIGDKVYGQIKVYDENHNFLGYH